MASIPEDLGGVEEALAGLVAAGASYSSQYPEASSVGGWWNAEPALKAPRVPPLSPDEARRAAVLVLFSWGSRSAGPELVLTERAAGLNSHPGQVSFPGGAEEEFDVDAAATALREAQEEIGLELSRVTVAGQLPPSPIPISGFMVDPVLAVCGDPGVLTPQTGEVERVIRFPVAELVVPENRYNSVLSRRRDGGGRKMKAPAFFDGETLVWGFTAIVLDRILNRLGWAAPWDPGRTIDPRDYLMLP